MRRLNILLPYKLLPETQLVGQTAHLNLGTFKQQLCPIKSGSALVEGTVKQLGELLTAKHFLLPCAKSASDCHLVFSSFFTVPGF